MWAWPSHLRTTLPFLVSTRALSWDRRGRDLVNSRTWSLVSSLATRWLMYSEPLSAWKPVTWKGKAVMRVSELGEEEVFGDAGDGGKVLELRDFVDDVDDVDPLLPAAVALVDGVDVQEAGPPAGPGLAPGADGDPGGARPAQGEAAGAVGPSLSEVVDVAVGDGGEALEARIAVDLELTPEELLGGGSGEVAAELVDLGQQGDIVRSVAAREGPGRGLAAAVADLAGPAVLRDQPGELGGRQAGHLAQKPSEEALGGSPEAVVAEADQRAADEGVGGVAVGEVDLDRVVAFEEGPDLVEGPNLFGAERHDHPSMICSPRLPCSSLAGKRLPAHAHLSLDKTDGCNRLPVRVRLGGSRAT